MSWGMPGSARRLKGLIRKEAYQIIRDPSSIAIAFVLPAILLVNLRLRRIPGRQGRAPGPGGGAALPGHYQPYRRVPSSPPGSSPS